MPKPPGSPQPPPPLLPLSTKLLVVNRCFSRIDPLLRPSSKLPRNLSVEFESAFVEQGFNRPAQPRRLVSFVIIRSRNARAERRLIVRPRLLLFIPLSAPKVCPKDDHQLVLYLPRINRRRAARRNANEPRGHGPPCQGDTDLPGRNQEGS